MPRIRLHLLISLLVITLNICGMGHAHIIEAPTVTAFEKSLMDADLNTLVIFDVDNVLIAPHDQILQSANKEALENLNGTLEKTYALPEAQKLQSLIMLQRQNAVVEAAMLALINSLKAKDIKVIALTNAWTGPFGQISSLEKWRVQELKQKGYDFSQSFPDQHFLQFTDLKSKEPDRFPCFLNGVIFTNNVPKGEALKAFLSRVDFKPSRIIFIDDKRKHLDSVAAYCNNAGIDFLGFHYTAIKNRPRSPLNKKRAAFQFHYLEKHGVWLGDKEAARRLLSTRRR